METRNYGLRIDPIVIGQDYILGGFGSIGGTVLQPDGQWLDFLPDNESQLDTSGFDPMACASFNTLNPIEILNRRLHGTDRNWSDRFLAKISGTTMQGNSPHTVAEALRKNGAPNEVDWPYPQTIANWDEYYVSIPQNILSLAQAFTDEFDFGHEYVVTTPEYLKKALTYSPLGISVSAWFKDGDLYYKPQGMQDNHWCTLVGYVEGQYWIIYDSYADNTEADPFIKHLRWDFAFQIAKRYSLDRKVVNETAWTKFIALLTWIFKGGAPAAVTPAPVQNPVAQPTPTPTTTPAPTGAEKLYKEALSWIGKDASPSDIADDELACAESVCTILRRVLPDFPIVVSTVKLLEILRDDPRFKVTLDFKPGNIVVSPTVGLTHGHTGICAEGNRIMSNTSANGLWENNYSIDGWVKSFRVSKGLRIYYFELVAA